MSFLHHSAAVHIPLALAILFPISQIVLMVLVKRKILPQQIWLLQWGVSALQVVACLAAYFTGSRDAVMSSAASEMLNSHEALAQSFTAIWAVIFVFIPLIALVRRRLFTLPVHVVLLVLLGAQLVLAIRLGQIGGKIVFGN